MSRTALVSGSPDRVAALAPALAEKNIRLFAEHVLPALKNT